MSSHWCAGPRTHAYRSFRAGRGAAWPAARSAMDSSSTSADWTGSSPRIRQRPPFAADRALCAKASTALPASLAGHFPLTHRAAPTARSAAWLPRIRPARTRCATARCARGSRHSTASSPTDRAPRFGAARRRPTSSRCVGFLRSPSSFAATSSPLPRATPAFARIRPVMASRLFPRAATSLTCSSAPRGHSCSSSEWSCASLH